MVWSPHFYFASGEADGYSAAGWANAGQYVWYGVSGYPSQSLAQLEAHLNVTLDLVESVHHRPAVIRLPFLIAAMSPFPSLQGVASLSMRNTLVVATLFLLPAIASGCAPLAGTQSELPPVHEVNVDACSKGDVTAQLAITDTIKDSFHEMIVCGGLAAGFSFSMSEILVNAAQGNSLVPSGFAFNGGGLYGSGTTMFIQAKLGRDFSFGKKGDDVPFDVFNPGSYFATATFQAKLAAGVSLSTGGGLASHTTGSVQFTAITGPGPGLELFGLDPKNLVNQPLDVAKMAESVGTAVVFTAAITVEDGRGVVYHLSSPETPINQLYLGQSLDIALTDITAEIGSQSASVVDWAMKYNPLEGGQMDGSITMGVQGDFDYFVKYSYPHRPEPDMFISCTQPM